MKRILLIFLIIMMAVVMLAGCAAKNWKAFDDFYAEFEDKPDINAIKSVLQGYSYKQHSTEAAENFTFENLEICGSKWNGNLYLMHDPVDLGMIIRKEFESKNERDEFLELVLNQLISEFGEGSREASDTKAFMRWEYDGRTLDLLVNDNENTYSVRLGYHVQYP